MKRKPCPSCGRPFQKGKYVWRLLPGGPTRQRVCKTCSGFAVPVLASDAPAHCQNCGENLAAICLGCIGKVIEAQSGRSIVSAFIKKK